MHHSQQLAAKAVSGVLSGKNLSQQLNALFKLSPHLTGQQRAMAQDLSYGTLRFYWRYAAILRQLLKKPLKAPTVEHLLLVALHQLSSSPAQAHTIVNQTVEAVAQSGHGWCKGLTNAVLRQFLRQQDTLITIAEQEPQARYCYPDWWLKKMQQQYPEHWQSILLTGNRHPPLTLRVNLRKTNVAAYQVLLSTAGIASRILGNQAICLLNPVPVENLPQFAQGWVSVQDWGAQLAAPLLDVQPGMAVLDACCAPGGKTGHLLELADIHLTALDHDAQRQQRTNENLARLGLSARLLTGSAAHHDWWDGTPFDRILADVPCSASGVVRRHVDIKHLRRNTDIVSFSQQQSAILPALWRLLAKGGKLLYVTCSLFSEENQAQIFAFLQQHPDAVSLPLPDLTAQMIQTIPRQAMIESRQMFAMQVLPCDAHDGFFYALLEKQH